MRDHNPQAAVDDILSRMSRIDPAKAQRVESLKRSRRYERGAP